MRCPRTWELHRWYPWWGDTLCRRHRLRTLGSRSHEKKEERLSVEAIGMHLATNPCIPRMVLVLPCWKKRKTEKVWKKRRRKTREREKKWEWTSRPRMNQRLHHVRASRPWHCTLPDIIPPPSSTLHCSHLCMQSLSITPIHSQLCISFTLAAQAHSSERNCCSSTLGSCCTTLIGTRWHTRKETYSASPILKVVCH